MKKKTKTIIISVVLWIPLAVVMFVHSTKDSVFEKYIVPVISFPALCFLTGIAALIVSGLVVLSFRIMKHIYGFETPDADNTSKVFGYVFSGMFCLIFVFAYYCAITNQDLFMKLYGGW